MDSKFHCFVLPRRVVLKKGNPVGTLVALVVCDQGRSDLFLRRNNMPENKGNPSGQKKQQGGQQQKSGTQYDPDNMSDRKQRTAGRPDDRKAETPTGRGRGDDDI
jgi:hypothetical protein